MHTKTPWTLGEENVGGGFNIYSGPLRIAHTSIQALVTRHGTRPIGEEEAKANAALIVEAVNAYSEMTGAAKALLASLDPDALNPEQFNAWSALTERLSPAA